MYCKSAKLSYEDKQVNLTIQLSPEEWAGLLASAKRDTNIEDLLVETCDAMFKLRVRRPDDR